ncbi:MAG: hypothetical protein ACQERC_12830, partial [Bacteroidota bacterium]
AAFFNLQAFTLKFFKTYFIFPLFQLISARLRGGKDRALFSGCKGFCEVFFKKMLIHRITD